MLLSEYYNSFLISRPREIKKSTVLDNLFGIVCIWQGFDDVAVHQVVDTIFSPGFHISRSIGGEIANAGRSRA